MGLFDSIFGDAKAVSSDQHRTRRASTRRLAKSRSVTATEVFGATTGDGRAINYIEEGYQENPYVHRGISLIASAVANLGVGVFDGREEPSRATGTAAEALLERPNPVMGKATFLEALVTKLLLNGEVYIEAVKPSRERAPQELYLPEPRKIDPKVSRSSDQLIEQYRQAENAQTWRPDEMHQIRLLNPGNRFKGQSILRAAARATDVGNHGMKYLHALLKANGVPPHLITVAGTMGGPEEQSRFEERFAARARDAFAQMRADGLPKPQLMDNAEDTSLEELGFSPSDMDLMDAVQQAAREVAVALGVAPELLGDAESSTYNNIEQAREALYHERAIPLAKRITGELTTWLGPQFDFSDERHFGFTTSDIPALQADPQKRRAQDLEALKHGAITVNEYRKRQGLEPVDGGDVLLIPGTATPTSTSVEPQPQE